MKKIILSLAFSLIFLQASLRAIITESTTVYIQNNTPYSFTIDDIAQTGGPRLDADHWGRIYPVSIVTPFMKKTALYWFSRNEGITWGDDFFFGVQLSKDNSLIGANQKVHGDFSGSTMYQSLGGHVSPTLYDSDSTGPRYTTWHLPGVDININYERYGTQGGDDIEIILDYTYPPPKGASDPNTLNILTYNIYMRPTTFLKNGQNERAEIIPDYVHGYDAIIFNEAFDDTARQTLLDGLRNEYPYQTKVVNTKLVLKFKSGESRLVETNGGVIIVSKYPITEEDQIVYDDCDGSDCLASKGALYAKINKSGVPYHIFATHTNAWATGPTRTQQFQVFKSFIDNKFKDEIIGADKLDSYKKTPRNIPANEAVIIGGDMNVDMNKDKDEYPEMMRILNVTHPQVVGFKDLQDGLFYTVHPKTNKLVDQDYSEFLDYIFYENNHRKPVSSFNEVLPLKSHTSWKEYFFETEYFDLSDHYPIYGHFEFSPETKIK